MIDSDTCDFSFAGLKTAVLYLLKNNPKINDEEKKHIAHEFENAVADVLWKKTSRALDETGAQTLVIGGGVSANKTLREAFAKKIFESYPNMKLLIPDHYLSTDNAIMIGIAGFLRYKAGGAAKNPESLRAEGNLALA